jgi:hypothetical protein
VKHLTKLLPACAIAALAVAVLILWPRLAPRASGPLPHEAYIWQRAWNEPVRQSLAGLSSNFASLVVLNAEVVWKQKQPQVVHVPIDYAALRAVPCRIGLALRIGSYPGPFDPDGTETRFLASLARSLLAKAKTNGLSIAELQIDFDCAESKLDGYSTWVAAIRRDVAPVPLVITALPSWLKKRSFERLARASGGFILQVHSLARPKNIETRFDLCDAKAARSAVERAAKLGVPFRVALPTYGYVMAFDRTGSFIGVSAEGPALDWPEGVQLRDVCADPNKMAGLVHDWTENRPASLQGVIWYRLPISGENLNWRWPTLSAVMSGRAPRRSLRTELRRPESGLIEITLLNDGESDLADRPVIEVRWRDGRLLAADGLGGYELVDSGQNAVHFRPQTQIQSSRIPAGGRQMIGWLRMDNNVEVQIEIL